MQEDLEEKISFFHVVKNYGLKKGFMYLGLRLALRNIGRFGGDETEVLRYQPEHYQNPDNVQSYNCSERGDTSKEVYYGRDYGYYDRDYGYCRDEYLDEYWAPPSVKKTTSNDDLTK